MLINNTDSFISHTNITNSEIVNGNSNQLLRFNIFSDTECQIFITAKVDCILSRLLVDITCLGCKKKLYTYAETTL